MIAQRINGGWGRGIFFQDTHGRTPLDRCLHGHRLLGRGGVRDALLESTVLLEFCTCPYMTYMTYMTDFALSERGSQKIQ